MCLNQVATIHHYLYLCFFFSKYLSCWFIILFFATQVMPLMKTLTFDLICSLLFGLEEGPVRQDLVGDFEEMMLGLWAVPINLPFTRFNRSLRASKIVHDKIMNLVEEKRLELQMGRISTHSDLISCLLNIAKDEGEALTEEEIADNVITALIAGYDTSSVVITFLIRHLANDPEVLAKVVQGSFIRSSSIDASFIIN